MEQDIKTSVAVPRHQERWLPTIVVDAKPNRWDCVGVLFRRLYSPRVAWLWAAMAAGSWFLTKHYAPDSQIVPVGSVVAMALLPGVLSWMYAEMMAAASTMRFTLDGSGVVPAKSINGFRPKRLPWDGLVVHENARAFLLVNKTHSLVLPKRDFSDRDVVALQSFFELDRT